MNSLDIAKHLHFTQMECGFEDTIPTADEIFASQKLFKVSKASDISYFNELHTYETLDFHDDYDEITYEEEIIDDEYSSDEDENIDDYDENQYSEIQNNFRLKEMQWTVGWGDEHPNKRIASINRRLRKFKYMYYITRFRQYIHMNGTRSEKR